MVYSERFVLECLCFIYRERGNVKNEKREEEKENKKLKKEPNKGRERERGR